MESVIASPPIANKFQRLLGLSFLKLVGWKAVGKVPDSPKFILIIAPHTSSLDLLFLLAVFNVLDIKISWFGKKEMFRWPVSGLFKWFGGVPINRSLRQNVVQQTVDKIQSQESLVISLAPEGTRSNTKYWKSGFYRIAHQAQIPIALGFLDYKEKVGGFGPVVNPSGDIDEDMKIIRRFYSGINARHPEKMGKIAIKPARE